MSPCLNMEGDIMRRQFTQFAFSSAHANAVRGFALNILVAVAGGVFASPSVEFDDAPTAECRDVTPPQRLTLYPHQRVIEVALPVSVRFHGATMDDVEELAIEVKGAAANLRVVDFSPATQLVSDIAREIELTTTTKKIRAFDASLGGTIPIPGAEAIAHLTPSMSADLSNSDIATEKFNRLPPKHAIVVSGTSSEGRGVFYKLKRYSQTSLEGLHELSITFVAPRTWQWSELRVDCAARGERKMLWIKQDATIGQSTRMVQLVATTPKPVKQLVLKPADGQPATATSKVETPEKTAPKAVPEWRPTRDAAPAAQVADASSDDSIGKAKKAIGGKVSKIGKKAD